MVNRGKADTWPTYSTRDVVVTFFCYRDIFFRFFFFFFSSVVSVKDIYLTGDLQMLLRATFHDLSTDGEWWEFFNG